MLAKPKQIVIDKESLIGINVDKLCNFAKNHCLLAGDALLYECATTSESDRRYIMDRYKRIIQAGACFCPCNVGFRRREAISCQPYPSLLCDSGITQEIRKLSVEDLLKSSVIEEVYQTRLNVAKNILEFSKNIKTRLENSDVSKAIKTLPSDPFKRFQVFLERIDSTNKLRKWCINLAKDWIKDETKFCPSPEWISWQFVRLTIAIVWNYYYLRQTGGTPKDEDEIAEHDYQDMEYVLLLSRADGILSCDKKLVKPLARAAFPDKGVFSNLEEVPEDYKCNWS